MTAFRAATATDAGRVRSSNQDLSLASVDLVAVADGMGGHVGGEVAARLAIETLQRSFADDRSVTGLVAAATTANQAVYEQANRDSALRGMGTTLTCAAIVRSGRNVRLVLANIGDSRAYLLRDGKLRQLTEDHSLVEEMVRNGELTPDAAAVHPHRHILTRALGIERSVSVDTFELEPTAGARLMLCSDGLTNECSDEQLLEVLTSRADPQRAANDLVQMALEHGGSDNVTVVVADIDPSLHSPADEPPRGRRGRVAGATAEVARQAPPPRREGTASREDGRGRRRRRRAERVLTVRVALFVVIFVGILGGAAGFVGWWVKATYYVGLDHGRVAIFEGRPGGFLWFKPSVVETTSLTSSSVYPQSVGPLEHGILESTLVAAQRVVTNLTNEKAILALPSVNTTGALGVVGVTTTTTTTTTTVTTTTTTVAPSSPSVHVRAHLSAPGTA